MQLKGRWQSWARTVETGQEWIWDTRWEPSQQAGLVCSCSELSLWWGQQRAGSVLASTCCFPQSCLTLCDPTDHSPPGSSVHEILQARIEERVAMSSSRGSSQPRDGTCVSCISYTAGGDAPGHQHTQNFLQHWVTPCVSPALTHFTEGPTSLSCHPPTHTTLSKQTQEPWKHHLASCSWASSWLGSRPFPFCGHPHPQSVLSMAGRATAQSPITPTPDS